LNDKTVPAMAEIYQAMESEAATSLAKEFGAGDVFFEHHAEMRYRGQRHNIKVPVSGLKNSEQVRSAFERDYRRRYGHADAKAPAEFQALHLSAFARLRQPEIALLPRAAAKAPPARTRRVYFGSAGGWVDAQIYHRDALEPGFGGTGPAVIEEYGSTTLVWPGDRFEIGVVREIRIQVSRS
jgi:N-methylhydantoinase A